MSTISDPMTAALNHLKFEIPLIILNKVFIQRTERWRSQHVSINDRIMEEVIRPRVLQDCNIKYGQMAVIDLSLCELMEDNGVYQKIYRVPKELTNGRSILSALEIGYNSQFMQQIGGQVSGVYNGSPLASATASLAANHDNMTLSSTASVSLVGENIVMISDSMNFGTNMFLRVILENDERMSNMGYKIIPILKKLVTYAVKAYIYVTYLTEMDQAELFGGQELGTFKQTIESYSDANELYETLLNEVYGRAAVSTDVAMKQRHIRHLIGNR